MSEINNQPSVPGMSLFDDNVGMDSLIEERQTHKGSLCFSTRTARNQMISQVSDVASVASGSEESVVIFSFSLERIQVLLNDHNPTSTLTKPLPLPPKPFPRLNTK